MIASLHRLDRVWGDLFQGNTLYSLDELREHQIRTVVNVSNHPDRQFRHDPPGIRYRHLPMKDDHLAQDEWATLRIAARFARTSLSRGGVLVHCDFGLNRSGVVVARALMYSGLKADEAIEKVRRARGRLALYNTDFVDWLHREDA